MNKVNVAIVAGMIAACISTLAAADSYEFHQKVGGLVKAPSAPVVEPPPAPPPTPACLNPRTEPIGTISDQFCGHEGIELFNVGQVGGRGILFSTVDDSTGSRWGTSLTVITPGVPVCGTAMTAAQCATFADGPAYTAAMTSHSTTSGQAVSVS